MQKYIRYEVYRRPTSPEKSGEYIGSTPILKQAQEAAKRLATPGGFVKGVKADGTKVILL